MCTNVLLHMFVVGVDVCHLWALLAPKIGML